jgi:transcriptional regulator NrdR family protein
MVCIYCGSKTSVENSRLQKRANRTWRRRHCPRCGSTVTTVESVDYNASITFTSQNGAYTPFERDILFVSVLDCLKHRKSATADATALTDTILRDIRNCMPSPGAVERDLLAELVATSLERFDNVSGMQYRAYHPLLPR